MKPAQIFKHTDSREYKTPANCIMAFLVIFMPLLAVAIFLRYYNQIMFHIALFLTGWVAWTFCEYMTHRYLMHSVKKEKQLIDFNHAHHHTHPTDIHISGVHRSLLFLGCIILLIISIWMNNYFTIAAGFLCGVPGYTLMHFFLHQKIAQKVFRKQVKYHIYHHCKYPDKCFGISVTWWDDLFGTIPSNPGIIPQRIIDFYLNHETKQRANLHSANTQKIMTNKHILKDEAAKKIYS